jgi:hypothetical protein
MAASRKGELLAADFRSGRRVARREPEPAPNIRSVVRTVGAPRKRLEDIRAIFGELADDVALDDRQSAAVCGVSVATWKRWRRLKKGPPGISLNGLPRQRVGDLRQWLRETI